METIKPCPFCGGEAKVVRRQWNYPKPYIVVCKNEECEASVGNYSTHKTEAIEAWNRRTP